MSYHTDVQSGLPLVGVTIVAKYDYCDSIDIAGSTIVILLLLWTTIAILLGYCCLKHLCLSGTDFRMETTEKFQHIVEVHFSCCN